MTMFTIPLLDLIRHKTWDVKRFLWDRERSIKKIATSYLTDFDDDSNPTISYFISATTSPIDEFSRFDEIAIGLEYFRVVGFSVSYEFNKHTALPKQTMKVQIKFALKVDLAAKVGFADND